MKYLVLEVHPAYAVVLDEEGRFLKAANLGYQVGSTVKDIVALRPPKSNITLLKKSTAYVAGLCACVCLVFFGYYRPNFLPYGSLRMQINPDVEMTISRTERVLALEGLNADGQLLIAGYDYKGKSQADAAHDLVERAIDMGYLSQGETVSITVTSTDKDWQKKEETAVRTKLEDAYGQTIVIQLGAAQEPPVTHPEETEIIVPVTPPHATASSVPPPAGSLEETDSDDDDADDNDDTAENDVNEDDDTDDTADDAGEDGNADDGDEDDAELDDDPD